jgi:hypothetical protein
LNYHITRVVPGRSRSPIPNEEEGGLVGSQSPP